MAKVDAIVNANLDAKYDTTVESNMGAIVGANLGMSYGKTNVDATTSARKDTNLDVKRSRTWMQNKMNKGM